MYHLNLVCKKLQIHFISSFFLYIFSLKKIVISNYIVNQFQLLITINYRITLNNSDFFMPIKTKKKFLTTFHFKLICIIHNLSIQIIFFF